MTTDEDRNGLENLRWTLHVIIMKTTSPQSPEARNLFTAIQTQAYYKVLPICTPLLQLQLFLRKSG